METKKIILIVLTVLILGPLIFVGTCFPIGLGLVGAFDVGDYSPSSMWAFIFYGSWILCLTFALWAVIAISKRIARK